MKVEFETAKLAKQLGFDYDCSYPYFSSDGAIDWDYWETRNWNNWEGYTSGPTQEILQKWLREEHGICVTAFPRYEGGFIAHIIRNPFDHLGVELEKTWEGAIELGLKQALIIIKDEYRREIEKNNRVK